MAVEKHSFIRIPLNFCVDDWAQSLDLNNLAGESLHAESLRPDFDMLGGSLKKAIAVPLFIESSGQIGDLDVLHEGGQC